MLDEHEDFTMQAYVEADGPQRVAVMGYLVKKEADGTYIAPLIPQLFFGANGAQLQTWRQDLVAGNQTILSRHGGQPSVPEHELWWRKVSENHVDKKEIPQQPIIQLAEPFPYAYVILPLAIIAGLVIIYKVMK